MLPRLLAALRARLERFAHASSPLCRRCGDGLDPLERNAGLCFDCDVVALATGDLTYAHERGVSHLVRAA